MKPKFEKVLELALEQGIARGYRRAFKHNENPAEGVILEHIQEQVMESLYEYFDFPSNDP
jgi:hypothetical protein